MMMHERFLEWIRNEIRQVEFKEETTIGDEREYNKGYLNALEEVETIVSYGTFSEIVSLKLKDNIEEIELKKDEVYEADSVNGGQHFAIYVEELDDIKLFERELFDTIEIYCPYDKK